MPARQVNALRATFRRGPATCCPASFWWAIKNIKMDLYKTPTKSRNNDERQRAITWIFMTG
jgi:hypothetical protein